MSFKFAIAAALTLSVPAAFAAPQEYDIDASHSSVGFKIRHIVSKTSGNFKKFAGKFTYDPKDDKVWKVEAEIDTATIDTNDKKRDEHLRSPDFFDVKKYPKMTFKSTKVLEHDDEKAKVEGDLTLHGVTKPVVLDIEYTGEGTDPWGNKKAGFTATTKIDRKDFGLTWNKTLDAGGVVVGDDVNIALEIEGTAAKAMADGKAASTKKAKTGKK
jgi:polyisoprenoid-binding protein YceI